MSAMASVDNLPSLHLIDDCVKAGAAATTPTSTADSLATSATSSHDSLSVEPLSARHKNSTKSASEVPLVTAVGRRLVEGLNFPALKGKLQSLFDRASRYIANEYLVEANESFTSCVKLLDEAIEIAGVDVYVHLQHRDLDVAELQPECPAFWFPSTTDASFIGGGKESRCFDCTRLPILEEPFQLLPPLEAGAKLNDLSPAPESGHPIQKDRTGRRTSVAALWALHDVPVLVFSKGSQMWTDAARRIDRNGAKKAEQPSVQARRIGALTRKTTTSTPLKEGLLPDLEIERIQEGYNRAPLLQLCDYLELPVIIQSLIRLRDGEVPSAAIGKTDQDSWFEAGCWLKEFIDVLVNHVHFHRMRWSMCQTQEAYDTLNAAREKAASGEFHHTSQQTFDVWWKMTEGKAVAVMDAVVEAPFLNLLTLLYEIDLHNTWIPFLRESRRRVELSTTCVIARHRTNLPRPLPNRESLLLATAVDALHVPGQEAIVVSGGSVPDEATAVWGVPLREHTPQDPVRISMKFFTCCLTPIREDRNRVKVKIVLNMNPEMPVLPVFLQAFLAKQAGARLFGVMNRMCGNGLPPAHRAKQESDKELYDLFLDRVEGFYTTQEAEG